MLGAHPVSLCQGWSWFPWLSSLLLLVPALVSLFAPELSDKAECCFSYSLRSSGTLAVVPEPREEFGVCMASGGGDPSIGPLG